MKQLAAMRGLMAKPSGEIIESPIISNLKRASRFSNTSTRPTAPARVRGHRVEDANSGYLTRRLVDVAQDSIITSFDCGSSNGIRMRAIVDAARSCVLAIRILGRFTAEDLLEQDGT